MTSVILELDAIYKLSKDVMVANGCDPENADALADIICRAERDGSHSHGLFRVPGYIKALRSGKVDGKAKPTIKHVCLLYTSPSPRDATLSRMPSSA